MMIAMPADIVSAICIVSDFLFVIGLQQRCFITLILFSCLMDACSSVTRGAPALDVSVRSIAAKDPRSSVERSGASPGWQVALQEIQALRCPRRAAHTCLDGKNILLFHGLYVCIISVI